MLEGPSAQQVLSQVFDGLDRDRIQDLQQLIADYEKQGSSASETLQRDFNREIGQYVPAEKHMKVALFEQICLKEGTTLFLAVDWLGSDAMTLVKKSEHYVQVNDRTGHWLWLANVFMNIACTVFVTGPFCADSASCPVSATRTYQSARLLERAHHRRGARRGQ